MFNKKRRVCVDGFSAILLIKSIARCFNNKEFKINHGLTRYFCTITELIMKFLNSEKSVIAEVGKF